MCEFHSVDQEKLSGWGHIAVACVGKRRGAYRVWVGKCEGKRALVCVCARARACVREGGVETERIILNWIFKKGHGLA